MRTSPRIKFHFIYKVKPHKHIGSLHSAANPLYPFLIRHILATQRMHSAVVRAADFTLSAVDILPPTQHQPPDRLACPGAG
jgi:hypothetical protein